MEDIRSLLEQRRNVVGGDPSPVVDDAGHVAYADDAYDAARLRTCAPEILLSFSLILSIAVHNDTKA